MKVDIDSRDLLKWARYFEDMPRFTKIAVVRALNTFGEGVVRETVRLIADKYNWDEDSVRQRLIVQEADEHNMEFIMDARLIVQPSQDWARPWRDRDQTAFEQDTLVNIVCFDDDACDLCREKAQEGPYTMSQIMDMKAEWADYEPPSRNILPGPITNLIHPRCRCTPQPWSSYRRLPVTFSGAFGTASRGGGAPTHLMTMKQLARAVKEEIKTEIRVRKVKY